MLKKMFLYLFREEGECISISPLNRSYEEIGFIWMIYYGIF